jgi:hypothetical protein
VSRHELARVIPIDDSRRKETNALHEHATDDANAVDNVTARMLAAVPPWPGCDRDPLRECIEATQAVAQAAMACADACLTEKMIDNLTGCVRTLLTTADICETTARVLSRRTGSDPTVVRALLTACWTACRAGREVSEELAPIHFHCQVCTRACRSGERACRALLAAMQ